MQGRLKTILVILTLSTLSFGETIINYSPISNETWTLDGSPYRIRANVTIDNLTIEPGVTVLFDGDYKFDVNDKLIAEGFYSDSIYFRPSPENNNGWQGINFKKGLLTSSLSYCRIDSSRTFGITIDNCSPVIRNCRIVNNKAYGIWVKDCLINLTHCIIANNNSTGIFLDPGKVIASNLVIAQNNGYGIFSTDTNDSLYLCNVTVIADSPNVGIYCETKKVFIKNSIIYGNINSIISSVNNLIL